ncbi:peroxiredoxin 1-like [Athalia rosae]|uniref:peroxiredoxin 1-like n=1 Tax=Athalia rosae TaxID=37344 RepID=UPI0006263622|nr:peroxiredoxin 1-like [Athalia rosae]
MSKEISTGNYYKRSVETNNEKPQSCMKKQYVPALLKPAPHWKGIAVVNSEFKEISLTDYRGKYLVFFFYPYDFTFICPTEIIQFSDRIDEFRNIDCEVVAASTDSQFAHYAWITTPRKQGGLGEMRIPLLADKSLQIAKDYGVLIDETGVPLRGLFIIDDKQNLRQITVNDLPVTRCVDETLRLVQAYQFTDKYGDMCPASWRPKQQAKDLETNECKDFFRLV